MFRSSLCIYLTIYFNNNLQISVAILRDPYDFRCHINKNIISAPQASSASTDHRIAISKCTYCPISYIRFSRLNKTHKKCRQKLELHILLLWEVVWGKKMQAIDNLKDLWVTNLRELRDKYVFSISVNLVAICTESLKALPVTCGLGELILNRFARYFKII